jgi:hypothetical protein
MASSYTTNFGIEEMATGDQSGDWGTTTNFNFDILDRITAYKAVALSDASTATLTVREASPGSGTENLQDGMFRVIKFTGSLSQNCTITIAPNTTTAFFVFIDGTSGGFSLIFSQGSGANYTLASGTRALVYCDGAGGGAVVAPALVEPLTTRGDIVVRNASNLTARLAVGSASNVVLTDGTDVSWGQVSLTAGVTGTLPVANGGTGATSLTDGGVLLGSGTSAVTAMSVLADSEMIVGDGSGDPVAESGATLRTSIGVGTGDSPQFTAVNIGAATDTTLARSGAGDLTIEGNAIYRAGGTDVPVADGGTGASTLTANYVLLGNGTSALQMIAPGADGQVLTSTGSTWQSEAAGGGAWAFLSVATASDSSSLVFTSSIDSTYDVYVFIIADLVPASDDRYLWMRTSTDGGSSYDSGSSDYVYTGVQAENGSYSYSAITSSGANVIYISNAGGQSDGSTHVGTGEVRLFKPSGTSKTEIHYKTGGGKSDDTIDMLSGVAFRDSAADVDAVQFFLNTGNITSGSIRMYGIKKS